MIPRWKNLHAKFSATLSSSHSDPDESWQKVWRIFAEDPWYLDEVERCARFLLQNSPLHQWLGDVCQDALLLLARQLRRAPDLHYDTTRGDEHFAEWIRTVISRDCREALRTIRRHDRIAYSIDSRDVAFDVREKMDIDLDVAAALNIVSEPARSLLRLYQRGFTIQECSRQLGLHPSSAYRSMRLGLKCLREQLSCPPMQQESSDRLPGKRETSTATCSEFERRKR